MIGKKIKTYAGVPRLPSSSSNHQIFQFHTYFVNRVGESHCTPISPIRMAKYAPIICVSPKKPPILPVRMAKCLHKTYPSTKCFKTDPMWELVSKWNPLRLICPLEKTQKWLCSDSGVRKAKSEENLHFWENGMHIHWMLSLCTR